jgi:hypothetical protein
MPTRPAMSQSNDLSRRDFLTQASLAMTWLMVPARLEVGQRLDPRPASEHRADVSVAWFDLSLDLVRTTAGYSPPVAARALAYLGLTLYESVVAGLPGFRSLSGQIPGLVAPNATRAGRRLHWPTSANAALAAATRSLFATTSASNHAAIDALEASFRPVGGPSGLVDASISWGKETAAAVLAAARTDGGHDGHLRNFSTDYVLPTGPGLWVPTPPGFSRALQPRWGENRTLAVPSGAHCASGDHPAFSDSPGSLFHQDAVEVYDTSNALTAEQVEIAQFWSDDPGSTPTPPGHSISILNQKIETDRLDLGRAAEAYLKVGVAVSDAFVTCWNTKYRYTLVRPVTYIRDLIDSEWSPLLTTPPFPEYTSGHSVQSGAAFGVMADLFGDQHSLVDHTHEARGMTPRTFTSFSHCADEAAISRLYGGIHFRPAIELGLEQGRCVADAVERLRLRVGKGA